MGLTHIAADEPDDEQKIETIIFPNPDHPDVQKFIHDDANAEQFYKDVKWLKSRYGHRIASLFGEFGSACREIEEDENYESLDELVDKLKDNQND